MGPTGVRRAARHDREALENAAHREPPIGSGGGLGARPAGDRGVDGRAREPIDPDRPASAAPGAGGAVPAGLRLAAAHQEPSSRGDWPSRRGGSAGTLRLDAHRRQLRTAPDPPTAAAPFEAGGRRDDLGVPQRSRRSSLSGMGADRSGRGPCRDRGDGPRDPGAPGGWTQLSVEDRETGDLVGDVGLSPAEDEPGVIKIGYTMSPAYQGRGYATEAVRRSSPTRSTRSAPTSSVRTRAR